jgi:hypothetical protein
MGHAIPKKRFGIGIITCERLDFLKKALNSLFKFNPMLKKYPLIICDDATNEKDFAKMKKLWPNALFHHYEKRAGAAKNLRKLFLRAESVLNLDLLFFMVNDMECIRKIDFPALLNFYASHPNAGQMQFVHYKGKIGDESRARRPKNWTTGQPIKKKRAIMVGKERLVPANWSYTNYAQIMPLNKADVCAGACDFANKPENHQKMELTLVKNWHNTGLQNYECQDQPFLNMDIGGKKHTKGAKP